MHYSNSHWLFILLGISLQACGGGGASSSGSVGVSSSSSISSVSSSSSSSSSVSSSSSSISSASSSSSSSSVSSSASSSSTSSSSAVSIAVTVNPASTHTISKWIYGINFYNGATNPPVTMDRAGGNRWTAYNWENNYSNAGNDYIYNNDTYISNSSIPAEPVRSFIAADRSLGLASIMTVQLQGLVSADANGVVSVTNPPDMTRFKTVVNKKNTVSAAAFTLNPPTGDANVYMDEFLWALDQKFSGQGIFTANASLPTFISLDNEPELWNSTHKEVQGPTLVTSDNYIAKTKDLAKALKDQFPGAVIFGPAHYGFAGIYRWQSELTATPNGSDWFTDKYLTQLKTASDAYGKPLVDVYDFHWYPEVYDAAGERIVNMSETTLTATQVQQLVQAPRDFWDPTWHDPNNSNPWVYQTLGSSPIKIIPRLQAKINAEFPGMKGLAITEYEGGGWNHIAGTIAQADMLGIFGAQNVYAASLWPPGGTFDYAIAGFRAFRGFDGANANFGDVSVQADSSDVSKVAIYVSKDSGNANRVVIVAINRSTVAQVTAINGIALSGTAYLYQITAASALGQSPVRPMSIGTQAVSGSSMTVTLPALSVTTIDVR